MKEAESQGDPGENNEDQIIDNAGRVISFFPNGRALILRREGIVVVETLTVGARL